MNLGKVRAKNFRGTVRIEASDILNMLSCIILWRMLTMLTRASVYAVRYCTYNDVLTSNEHPSHPSQDERVKSLNIHSSSVVYIFMLSTVYILAMFIFLWDVELAVIFYYWFVALYTVLYYVFIFDNKLFIAYV